ncbi:PfkB family carbohydrate kinase [Nocardioides pacificus]
MTSQPVGLFIGLNTLDVIQLVERLPAPDEKVVALDVGVAAGGPATNAAVAFAALGGRATLLTRLGHDPAGALVAADLAAHGVEVVDAEPESDATTPTLTTVASILVTRASAERAVISAVDRGRSSDRPGAGRHLDLLARVRPDVVLVDSYETDLSIPLTEAARAQSVPVVLDCGAKKPYTDHQLPHVSVAVVSERYLPGGPAEIVDQVRSHGVPYGAVTAGSGAVTHWAPSSDVAALAVPEVRAVDTLGAGDFFHGALAYYLGCDGLSDQGFADALQRAAKVAALSVQSFGSRAWLAQLGDL